MGRNDCRINRSGLLSVFTLCRRTHPDAHTRRAWFYLCQLCCNLWPGAAGMHSDCDRDFMELAAYTSTPLFMVGFAGLYPELWVVMTVGLIGLAYSVYLLYVGVPILMHIPEERGFIYASSVVTCGLVLLVCILTATAILWS